MPVVTPAPKPNGEIFQEISQLQNKLHREDTKTWVDVNKEYKKLKEKKPKTQQLH